MSDNVICKENFAPARTLNPKRLKEVIDARIKLIDGAGADGGKLPQDKQICIMEATAYILGYKHINDRPPCTSAVIREFMISVNDSVSPRKRAQLKKVIPEIINTAPIIQYKNGNTKTLSRDPDYANAESIREKILNDTFGEDRYEDDDYLSKYTMPKILDVIRKMAAVAKFNSLPIEENNNV